MNWAAAFLVLLVSHVGGDFLFQTEWQATTKGLGFTDPEGRRALILHMSTYMSAYLPALVWIALNRSAAVALLVGVAVALPHIVIDDGQIVRGWLRRVKHVSDPNQMLRLMVDQSMHVVCLLGAALLAVL